MNTVKRKRGRPLKDDSLLFDHVADLMVASPNSAIWSVAHRVVRSQVTPADLKRLNVKPDSIVRRLVRKWPKQQPILIERARMRYGQRLEREAAARKADFDRLMTTAFSKLALATKEIKMPSWIGMGLPHVSATDLGVLGFHLKLHACAAKLPAELKLGFAHLANSEKVVTPWTKLAEALPGAFWRPFDSEMLERLARIYPHPNRLPLNR